MMTGKKSSKQTDESERSLQGTQMQQMNILPRCSMSSDLSPVLERHVHHEPGSLQDRPMMTRAWRKDTGNCYQRGCETSNLADDANQHGLH